MTWGKMESMQKYIEVLEENLELHKYMVTENEKLKAEMQKLKMHKISQQSGATVKLHLRQTCEM